MAAVVGTVTNFANAYRSICLATGVTATTAAPSLATDGVPNYPTERVYGSDTGACYATRAARESMLNVFSTAGSGAVSGTFILWGFLGPGTAGGNGPNGGAGKWVQVVSVFGGALSGTAPVSKAERELDLGLYDRLYLQCTAISGTSAAFEAWLSTARLGGQGE